MSPPKSQPNATSNLLADLLTDEEIMSVAVTAADALDATRVSEFENGKWKATTIFEGDEGLLRFGRLVEQAAKARRSEKLPRSPSTTRRPRMSSGHDKSCHWTQDEDGIYHTGCGNAFTFDSGTAAENRAKFCQYCGGDLIATEHVDEPA